MGVNPFGEWIFKLLKPILPEFVLRKISIFGSDLEEFKNQIKEFMDVRQLPAYLVSKETELPTSQTLRKK
jgi:hypothetical protein